MARGKFDHIQGGHYYWDPEENLWWSWDTPDMIAKKFPAIMVKKKMGGSFAWGLGEDGDDFTHFKALTAEMKKFGKKYQGEKLDAKSISGARSQIKDEL